MRELKAEYFNLYTVLRDLFRNLWVIFFAAVIGFLGIRAYFLFTYTPVYSSSTTIAINAVDSGVYSYSNLNKTIEAAATFQEMFQSSYFKEKLTETTGTNVSGTIAATQISETNLITINYTCSTPVDSYSVLTDVIKYYNEITDYNFENMIITTISPPTVPTSPSNPIVYGNYCRYAALGLAALAFLIIVALSYFRDTIKNESDVAAMLDTTIFSVVYHEDKNKTLASKLRLMHSSQPLMITNILINYRFSEAFKIMALKLEYMINTNKLKSLMITSIGENEGKTTVAVNIALALASIDKKVLLIDADMRKPAVYKFFMDAKSNDDVPGLGEILRGNATVSETIRKGKSNGLYYMCGNKNYRNSFEMLSAKRFEKLINAIKEQFDLIIFDTSPTSLVADAEIVATYVDGALTVVRQDVAAVPEINDMIDTLTQAGTEVLGCILNDVHTLPFSSVETQDQKVNADVKPEVKKNE